MEPGSDDSFCPNLVDVPDNKGSVRYWSSHKRSGSGARRKVIIKPFMTHKLCACRPSLQSGGQGLQQQEQASRLIRA